MPSSMISGVGFPAYAAVMEIDISVSIMRVDVLLFIVYSPTGHEGWINKLALFFRHPIPHLLTYFLSI